MLDAFALLDESRREAGRALDAAGLGPQRAPSRIVATMHGARLLAYQPPDALPAARRALLIVPAPIKRAYIWDLMPEVSVVRHALRRGLRTFLLEWLDPTPAERGFGLTDYADRLILAALDAVAAEGGGTAPVLAGHSLGGTFAAIFAALHPQRVRGLVLADAPLAFGPEHGGPLARAVTATVPGPRLRGRTGHPVPGFLMASLSTAAVPEVFLFQRWADLGASATDPLARAIHARVERWMLDELAMPAPLYEDVLESFYRDDRLVAGTLMISGRRVGLGALRSPVLAVLNPGGVVVPPASVLAGLATAPASLPRRLLSYDGEPGPALQHLGPLVGPMAHARLWPNIFDWVIAQTG